MKIKYAEVDARRRDPCAAKIQNGVNDEESELQNGQRRGRCDVQNGTATVETGETQSARAREGWGVPWRRGGRRGRELTCPGRRTSRARRHGRRRPWASMAVGRR